MNEYIVTCRSYEDLEDLYDDMETPGGSLYIPDRAVDLVHRRAISRNTHYMLTEEEAAEIRNDERVIACERLAKDRGITPTPFWTQTNDFNKTTGTFASDDKNWGLYRVIEGDSVTNWGSDGTDEITNRTIVTTSSGKNVDVVIMDGGVRWDHPEFLKPGVTTFVDKESTRVRDILIHGASEYGINWSNEGLTAPGSGTLANYTVANVLESSTFNGSWHGSHVAGTATGNQFGAAFESNVWSIACIDRSDVGFSDPADGFDYIRVWHKNKPINPVTGRRNPTIVNGSWGFRQFVVWNFPSNATFAYTATFRGATHDGTDIFGSNSYLPAMYYMDKLEFGTVGGSPAFWFEFTSKHATSQTTTDELFDDPDCNDLIVVLSAGNFGNSNGKLDLPGGVDYDNEITSGYTYYGNQVTEDNGAVDEYYNRPGTPAIAHLGQSDAPIIVGAMDSVVLNTGITSERKASYSNTGPAVDVWAAGSTILSPYSNGYQDPRNTSFFNNYLQGTSMSSPNVTGVLACYLESNPSATRVDVRNWLKRHGSVLVDRGPGNPFYDQ